MNNAAVTCQFYLLSHFRPAISIAFRFGTPPISLNKWIVPTYGWTNKESPLKNLAALSTNPWKHTSSTRKERSFQQPPFFKEASRLLVLGCVDSVQSCVLCVYHLERIEWIRQVNLLCGTSSKKSSSPMTTSGGTSAHARVAKEQQLLAEETWSSGGWLNQPLCKICASQIHSLAG